jgi:hypothetical protein
MLATPGMVLLRATSTAGVAAPAHHLVPVAWRVLLALVASTPTGAVAFLAVGQAVAGMPRNQQLYWAVWLGLAQIITLGLLVVAAVIWNVARARGPRPRVRD